MTSMKLCSTSIYLLLLGAPFLACGSSTSSTQTPDAGAVKLGSVGDDCASNAACASGLCDNSGFCAAPIQTVDGGKCSVDTDCPTGDHCNVPTGECFSSAMDDGGTTNGCKTNADCAADETCSAAHICQG